MRLAAGNDCCLDSAFQMVTNEQGNSAVVYEACYVIAFPAMELLGSSQRYFVFKELDEPNRYRLRCARFLLSSAN